MSRKKWLAVVRGKKWVVARISRNKNKLNILRLDEFQHRTFPYQPLNSDQETSGVQETGEGTQEDYLSALKAWLKKRKVSLKKLELAISCPGVITRMITLPFLSEKDLERLLTEQVDQYFTLNIAEYIIDYRVLERVQEDGQMRIRVLLAAIPKVRWEEYWSIWDKLGFAPKITDLAADCLARLYPRLDFFTAKRVNNPAEAVRDMAIVDLNSERVEFVLLEHGVLFLYSDMEVMFEGLLDSIRNLKPAQQVEEPVPAAEPNNEQNNDVPSNDGLIEFRPELEPETLEQRLKREMEEVLNPVFNTLVEFLNFFAARHYGKSVDCVYITGEYADLPFLAEVFERNLGIMAKAGFPNDWQPSYKKKLKALNKTWMRYGSLYGLAIRED